MIVIVAPLIFPILWAALYCLLPHKAVSWDMDFGHPIEPKSFFYLQTRYGTIFREIFWASLAGAGVTLWRGNQTAAILFGFAIVYSVTFQAALLFFYEAYLHAKYKPVVDRPPHPTRSYSATLALAFSTLLFFGSAVAGAVLNWR